MKKKNSIHWKWFYLRIIGTIGRKGLASDKFYVRRCDTCDLLNLICWIILPLSRWTNHKQNTKQKTSSQKQFEQYCMPNKNQIDIVTAWMHSYEQTNEKKQTAIESIRSLCCVEGILGFDGRRGTRLSSASSPRTPTSGGSLKIGRRSHERSKSPFRSFRWKRGSSKATDSDDEEGNKFIFHTHIRA